MFIDLLVALAAFWLGSLFTYSGALKLVASRAELIKTVEGYRLVPAAGTRLIALGLPYVEVASGAVILLTPWVRLGAATTAVLGLAFVVATGSALLRGLKAACGCAGSSSGFVRSSGLARAVLIIVASLCAALSGSGAALNAGGLVFALALAPAVALTVKQRRAQRLVHRHVGHVHHPVAVIRP